MIQPVQKLMDMVRQLHANARSLALPSKQVLAGPSCWPLHPKQNDAAAQYYCKAFDQI